LLATPANCADLLGRLRARTRAEHTAIEGALDLMRDDLSLSDYRRLLERFFGFYAPVEAQLACLLPRAGLGLDFEARRKLPWLRADLEALGELAPDSLAVCDALPMLHTPAQAVGCLYVLEGATLGGQLIVRHVLRTLGLTPETGARFFHGNGARTAEMWLALRTALAGFAADPPTAEAAVESANATFRSLRHWSATVRSTKENP